MRLKLRVTMPNSAGFVMLFPQRMGQPWDLIRNFGDFHMFQLVPRDGVLVLGFAKAFTVTGSDFAIAAHISKA